MNRFLRLCAGLTVLAGITTAQNDDPDLRLMHAETSDLLQVLWAPDTEPTAPPVDYAGAILIQVSGDRPDFELGGILVADAVLLLDASLEVRLPKIPWDDDAMPDVRVQPVVFLDDDGLRFGPIRTMDQLFRDAGFCHDGETCRGVP